MELETCREPRCATAIAAGAVCIECGLAPGERGHAHRLADGFTICVPCRAAAWEMAAAARARAAAYAR